LNRKKFKKREYLSKILISLNKKIKKINFKKLKRSKRLKRRRFLKNPQKKLRKAALKNPNHLKLRNQFIR
jgi:hypothetical protein